MPPAAMATAANIATFAATSTYVPGTLAVRWRNARFSSARGVAGRGTGMETAVGAFRPNRRCIQLSGRIISTNRDAPARTAPRFALLKNNYFALQRHSWLNRGDV